MSYANPSLSDHLAYYYAASAPYQVAAENAMRAAAAAAQRRMTPLRDHASNMHLARAISTGAAAAALMSANSYPGSSKAGPRTLSGFISRAPPIAASHRSRRRPFRPFKTRRYRPRYNSRYRRNYYY